MNTMFKRMIICLLLSLPVGISVSAQERTTDLLLPIERYFATGDVDSLSRWFAEALDVTIFSRTNESSINQARQILQTFFNIYTPRDCKISHVVDKDNAEYALGYLKAGGQNFMVSLFISKQDSTCTIQQVKIDRSTGNRYR